MFGFRPGCLALYLAHIKGCESSSVPLSKSSHSVQHHTNAGKNHGVVYLHGRCCTLSDERRLLGCAVGTMAGPPAQGGMQILGGVPLFQLSTAIRLGPTGQCTFEERLRVDSVVSLTLVLSVGCPSDVYVAILALRT